MVNGPACQACGWTLRWAPEQNAWACDRCRAVVPAQPAYAPQGQQPPQQAFAPAGQPGYAPQGQAPGQPGYAPQGQPPYAQGQPYAQPAPQPHAPGYPPQGQQPVHAQPGAASGGKSSKGLWIAIGGAVAVAGIVVAVVLATRGGGDSASTDEVASADKDKADPDKADKGDTAKPADKAKGADAPAGADGYTQMLAKMTGFKDRACACKDKPCIDTVSADMAKWSTDQGKNPPKMGKVDQSQMKQLTAVMDGFTKCMTDVYVAIANAGTPPTPPVPVVGTAEAPPPPPPAAAFAVGDRVIARWTNGSWYPGKIAAVRADGTFDVNYDDGDRSKGLSASKIRKRTATTASTTKSTGKTTSSRPASDAPCPGPGITRRCNGVCVNIQENSNHCGGCNNRCPAGKSCDGHLFCRDAAGNL
jgi:hypothetical protein